MRILSRIFNRQGIGGLLARMVNTVGGVFGKLWFNSPSNSGLLVTLNGDID